MLPWILGVAAVIAVILGIVVLLRGRSSGRTTLRIDNR